MIQCTEMTFSCGNKQSNNEEVEIRWVDGRKEEEQRHWGHITFREEPKIPV